MTDTKTFKQRLETELDQVTEQLRSLGRQNPEVPKDWIIAKSDVGDKDQADENVTADEREEWHINSPILDELETRRNNLVYALKKLDTGQFGVCEVCGSKIEAERLEANPAARTCLTHKDEELETA